MILDFHGRIIPAFAPMPRYRPGMHEKRKPFCIKLSRLSRLQIWRGVNRRAFYPGCFDAEYRFIARLSGKRVFCLNGGTDV